MPAIPKANSPNVAGSGTEIMGNPFVVLAQALETVSSIRRATGDAIRSQLIRTFIFHTLFNETIVLLE